LKLDLVLIDKDELYLEVVADYIVKNSKLFNVVGFTGVKYFKDYISKAKADIVLFGSTDEVLENTSEEILYLKWGADIQKYQKIDDMLEQIMLKYAEKTGDIRGININDERSKVISIYSPIGGSGKTTLALAAASMAQSKGIDTLYLNFERFSSISYFFDISEQNNLSEIFLSVKERNPNLLVNILKNKMVERKSKIMYFSPPESQSEFDELTGEDIKYFLDEIKKLEEFKFIIVDLDTSLNNNTVEILNNSDKILIPIFNDNMSAIKLKQFYKELDIHYKDTSIRDKIIPVINKSDSLNPIEGIKEMYGEKGIIIPRFNESQTAELDSLGNMFEEHLKGIIG